MFLNSSESIKQAEALLLAEFQTGEFLRQEFPMLAQWGVEDYGLTVHSLGLNYLSAFGRHSGFWAVTDFPIIPSNGFSRSRKIRQDVVWFQKPDGKIVLLGEFERYEPFWGKRNLIREKAESLVIAHYQLGEEPRLLVLGLWTTTGIPVIGVGDIRVHIRSGFCDALGDRIPALCQEIPFIIVSFAFRKSLNGLVLGEVLL